MEKLRNKNILKRTAAAGVGVLALLASGCGEYKDVGWDLKVICADEATDPNISNIQDGSPRSLASFEIDCEGETPKSVEVLAGPGSDSKKGNEFSSNVEVSVRGYEDIAQGFSPDLKMVSEDSGAIIVQITDSADFQRVAVVPSE